MDYDEFSKDDLIGGTQIKLYELLGNSSMELCVKRLLDDRSVSQLYYDNQLIDSIHNVRGIQL